MYCVEPICRAEKLLLLCIHKGDIPMRLLEERVYMSDCCALLRTALQKIGLDSQLLELRQRVTCISFPDVPRWV